MAKPRLLVIGNGMASLRFLEEVVAIAPGKFDITVAGEEPQPAYNRVLLSPILAGEIEPEQVPLKPRGWYQDHGVRLLTGTSVERLDAGLKIATIAEGETIAFDTCVLATGSNAIKLPVPGKDLEGVEVFRTLADVPRLTRAAQGGEHVVVIGGGLLGIEAAYGLKRSGANVTLLHLMDRLMERQLDAEGAGLLKTAIEARGISVLLQADTEQIEDEPHARVVCLKDGRRIRASLVIMAIGIKPNARLPAAAGIATGRGVIVSDDMQTNVAGIYAIGECAEHDGVVYGLVEPVYEQARVAAHVICGRAASFSRMTLATNLKVSGLPVFSAGDVDGRGCEHIIWRDCPGGSYRKFAIRDDRLTGAVLVGDTSDALWYRDLIRDGADITKLRTGLAFGRTCAEAA